MVYKDRAKETLNQDDKTEEELNKMERSVYSGWTYLEFTEYWLQSILSHTVGLTPNEKMEDSDGMDRAPLILVATHAEGISRKEGEAYFRDLRDKLPKLSAHVDYGKAFSTAFGDNLQEIKNCILNVVQTLPNWGKNIPMSWFYIECQIRKLKKLKIITLEGLLENCMTNDIGIQSQNDLKTPLRFLSNIGVVLYFDEEFLKQVIILDVQWFVDAFKHVITDAEHAKLDVDQKLYEEWKSFSETGLLTSYLLHSIWKRCPEGALYISKKREILSYMVRLNLLTVVSKDTWYCPCMNKQIFPTKEFEHLENSSPLCFQFSYLPKDMFHRVIAACCNQLKWTIFKMEYLCIYQMATLFDVNGSKVLVGMYSINKIVVQYLDISQSKMVDNLGVRGKITKVIDMSAERLKNCTYEVGYMCQKNVFGKENVPISHFIAESKMTGERINCPKCGFQRKVIVEEIIWKESLKDMRQDSGSRELIHSEKDLKVSETVNKKTTKHSEEKPIRIRESAQGPSPSHSHDHVDGHTKPVDAVVTSLYSDIEIDDHGDEIDSPKTTDKHKKDDRPFEELSAEEREHRISEVADRLKFIGNKAVERYNTESSSSAVESPHGEAGSHSSNDQLVQQLIAEFRREGHRLSQDYNRGSLTPVVLDIARQHNYTQFKKVIHSSLHSTIGWDQIALYFYLTRTAVHVAKGSVGLAQMAYDYFKETYSGWVEDRGGWETMLEETDCELD